MKLVEKMKNNLFFFIFITAIIYFFHPFLIYGRLPIPSDTIIGLYYPFRDLYSKNYPNGIPFKNFLITDPVRQTYVWKNLSIEQLFSPRVQLWNPYEETGKPLLGNFQSGALYPLNCIFLIKPFYISWSLFILLQPLLAGIFLYLYLNNLNIDKKASLLGVISFSFSGFFVSWLEWGNVLHTALWLPMILLSIDRIYYYFFNKQKLQLNLKIKKCLIYSFIFTFSLISSFLAGHLQIFFYVLIFSSLYFIARFIQFGRNIKLFILFSICYLLFAALTSVQWIPTLQFILLSARGLDQIYSQVQGWFIPWQNLIQFVVPDFFGNPATLNYWGIFNYAEFVGYIGIVPLIFAIYALFTRIDKKTLFFGTMLFISLLFSLPTPIAQIPYKLAIPFLSTSQPTRLIFIISFSLSVLCALGLDYYLKNNIKIFNKGLGLSLLFIGLIFIALWVFVYFGNNFNLLPSENLLIAKRNLYFPSGIFFISCILIIMYQITKIKKIQKLFILMLIFIACFDLVRFANKFEPFTLKEYLFPSTKTTDFLKSQKGIFRIASADSKIFPPNFSSYYKIQSIDSYDPLYLLNYAQLIAASERGKADISSPFGFNRIITPHNISSKFIDLLNVKYVLSLSDINMPKFKKVFQEGRTYVYENLDFFPRVFFVKNVINVKNNQDEINKLFEANLQDTATITGFSKMNLSIGYAKILSYNDDKIIINTDNKGNGFLVLTDTYYPTWRVIIDGEPNQIYKTDYAFRGVFVTKGNHTIVFYNSWLLL